MVIDRDQVAILWSQLRSQRRKISTATTTRKTKGKSYPIPLGYSKAVRRPMRDILRWMEAVEDLLEMLVEEVDN